ncbi:eukaryotic translation initiation factor 3 subunit K-like [Crassostrea angulata]|uniref:Eukaryotic translation initiation factor 3 subunit K n=1 Tax=Magallana gigas TaxID=29159 RepID=K1PVQ8_MAGGI|nr:eukaryotic translation initiation factor 3 subunit K [Crassostrea gigas]XP_052699987.1 eukaryotic translation initiation factor 3 subunit K-like [Crassostrea angulata]|eukprot:XP_011439558.1 PREDICTED: eukaryotic translation initiation factor 3 subunit K [Crassostrea gigas]
MAEAMRANVAALLKGIDRYNPENLGTLEKYIHMQAQEGTYDLEANLAVLKLYQFNPMHYQTTVACQILLKALTNMPHTDFTLCKCLIDAVRHDEEPTAQVMNLAHLLETCQFREFWGALRTNPDLTANIRGFDDSIRKFVCHVIAATYQTIPSDLLKELLGDIPEDQVQQWINKYGWKLQEDGNVFIVNQEENIKTKNITETITFESVAGIMAHCR